MSNGYPNCDTCQWHNTPEVCNECEDESEWEPEEVDDEEESILSLEVAA